MFRKALDGEERLWVVFWVYYLGIGLLLNTVGFILLLYLGNFSIVLMLLVGVAIWFSWFYFSAIFIWRNSKNSHSHFFSGAAKFVFVFWPIMGILFEVYNASNT